ncbi:MAG: hypothetical protein ACLFUJ_10655 [Phycisphaerae bacterium]
MNQITLRNVVLAAVLAAAVSVGSAQSSGGQFDGVRTVSTSTAEPGRTVSTGEPAPAPVVVAQPEASPGTTDTEQIIDVEKITKAVRDSTEPLYQSLEDTRLKQRFETVKTLLAQPKVDRAQLLYALKDLKAGIDGFTGKWESIVDPLWTGHDALADAIDSIREKVPNYGTGEIPEKTQALLDTYDKRLHDLALKIKETPEPERKARLQKVFQNLLSLRQFTEKLGRAGIHKVKVKLMLRTVQILARLQDQLMDATFELEKVRSILASESEFINDYVELLQMARTANDLLVMLRDMRQDGKGLGGIPSKVSDVRMSTDEITQGLTAASEGVLDDLESELDLMADEMDESATSEVETMTDVELENEIERYSTMTVRGKQFIVVD